MQDPSEALRALRQHLAAAGDSAGDSKSQRQTRLQQQESEGTSFAVMEDASLQETSSTLVLFSQQIQLIHIVRRRITDAS